MATFAVPQPEVFVQVSADEAAVAGPTTESVTAPRSAVGASGTAVTVKGVAKSSHAQSRYLVAAYGLVVGGALLGWGIDVWRNHPAAPVAVTGLGAFAALYVGAQAIERAIEPISEWTGTALGKIPDVPDVGDATPKDKRATKTDLKLIRATAIMQATSAGATGDQQKAEKAAKAQAAVDLERRNSATLIWGLASLLGMVVSALSGLALLLSVGAGAAPRWLDIVVTGLAIGGGTKPLHDLISNLQAAKDDKKNPPEVRSG